MFVIRSEERLLNKQTKNAVFDGGDGICKEIYSRKVSSKAWPFSKHVQDIQKMEVRLENVEK
jgi:hypothetical protein